MKKLIVLLTIIIISSCEKQESSSLNFNEKKSNTNTNPCANYQIYLPQYLPSTDWNITIDTSICGTVIIRWDNQPGFVSYTDPCNSIHGKYYLNIQPRPNTCSGVTSTTNSYYYTLGSGCSMFPGGQYSVDISWVKRDTTAQRNIYNISTTKQFSAGIRAPWLNNCN